MESANWQAAFRELESNPVFLAWRTEQRSRAKGSLLQHPAFQPLAIATASLALVYAIAIMRMLAFPYSGGQTQWFFKVLALILPALAQVWAIPLIYYSLRDALLLLANAPNSRGLTQLVSQAAISPMRDHELLVAALRACWPRLILAAFGSAYMFWIMTIIVAWPVSAQYSRDFMSGNLIDLLLTQGSVTALLTGIAGTLGGLILLLVLFSLGLNLNRGGLVSAAAGLSLLQLLVISSSGIGYASYFGAYYLLEPGYALVFSGAAAAALWLVLAIGLRSLWFRLVSGLAIFIALRALAYGLLLPLAQSGDSLVQGGNPIVEFAWACNWLLQSISVISPCLAPGEATAIPWVGAVVPEENSFQLAGEFMRYLLVIALQVGLIAIAARYARLAVRKWRQSGL